MLIDNISFYDKDGFPYEFKKVVDEDKNTYLYTEIYLQPISVSLYDTINIFMLEKFDDGLYFPQLSNGEKLKFLWNDVVEDGEEQNFFLFNIEKDPETQYPYIDTVNSVVLNPENDSKYFKKIYGTKIGKVPYQLNVAFTPSDEAIYERDLNIYYIDAEGNQKLAWRLHFYGEGIEEDDRFRVHLENFGIKFNRTDALCLKDYNINEALPDWEEINTIRKELIVNKEEIFPYAGTYYGLKNIISLLGYKDVLDVKEYWEDVSKSSLYRGKFLITSISSMLEEGEIKNFNVLDSNKSVKNSDYFRKTGFLALCYEFTKKTGELDENECPIIKRTTDFTSNEMFFKLHKLKKILQKQFLPVNVQIKDVIGEFVYYISFAKLVWVDDVEIHDIVIADEHENININIFPNNVQTYVQDLYKFYNIKNEGGIQVPSKTVNTYDIDGLPHIDDGAYLTDDNIPTYCEMIKDFYSYELDDIRDMNRDFDRYPDDFGDLLKEGLTEYKIKEYQNHKTIGCPIIFSLDVPELKMEDLRFTKAEDYFKYPKEVVNNAIVKYLKYKDIMEIEWEVVYSEGYHLDGTKRVETLLYTYRTSIWKGIYFPVFLKYAGLYSIKAKLYDLTGNMTKKVLMKCVNVKGEYPEVIAGFIGDDKFDFNVSNLKNVRISDFAYSTAEKPVVNILNNNESKELDIQHTKIDTFKISSWIDKTEVYNFETRAWENYKTTTNVNREQYGFGDGVALKASLFKNAQMKDLFHLRSCDCYFSHDFISGFSMNGVKKGDILKIGKTSIEIPYDNIYDITDFLNGKKGVLPRETMKVLSKYHFDTTYCSNWRGDEDDTTCICDMDDFVQPEFNPEPNVIAAAATSVSVDAFDFVELEGSGELDRDYSFVYQRGSREFAKQKLIDSGLGKYTPLLSLDIPINEIMSFDSTTYKSMISKGYDKRLPVLFNENYLNLQTSKFERGNVVIPTYKIIILFTNNIDRKVEFKWTLKNSITGEILMMTRNCPYFIWHFDYEGIFDITFYTKDAYGNEYEVENKNFIQVVKKDEYIDTVEKSINVKINNKK